MLVIVKNVIQNYGQLRIKIGYIGSQNLRKIEKQGVELIYKEEEESRISSVAEWLRRRS